MEQSEIDLWLGRYPEMVYRKETDDFLYKDIVLEPFVWGIRRPIDDGGPCEKCGQHIIKPRPFNGTLLSYGLRHKKHPWIWLFTYDTPENMWRQFTNDVDKLELEYKKGEKKPLWKTILGI